MTTRILALDLGTSCGWALFEDGQPVGSGVWTLQTASQRRFEGAGMKWLRLRSRMDEVVGLRGHLHCVAVEEVRRHMGVDAAHAYGGALAVVTSWCEANAVPYQGFPVATVKKHATGKGNAKKDAMIEAARARWPDVDLAGDDQADALWIGSLASDETRVTVREVG
jgi:Holliday junction resolvasome RuvABC endonuclease subunit